MVEVFRDQQRLWPKNCPNGKDEQSQHLRPRRHHSSKSASPATPSGSTPDHYLRPTGVTNPFWCIRRGFLGIEFSIKPAAQRVLLPSLFRFSIPRACRSKASCPRGTYVSDVPFPRACPGAIASNLQSIKGERSIVYECECVFSEAQMLILHQATTVNVTYYN
jgi:hypothetical protein